jgi:Flp pilus assembly protein CpaB
VEATRYQSAGDLKGLLATRRGTLIVALACAVAAAAILVFAINRYRHNLNSTNNQVSVLVATSLIQQGTSGAEVAASQQYTVRKFSSKLVTAGAFTDAGLLQGKVALENILPGQELTSADFGIGSGVALQLAANQRAITIPLDASHGLGGVLQNGSRVDMWVELSGSGQAGTQLRLLIPNAEVLEASATGTGGPGDVVFAVNASQAAEVAYASDNGRIWLFLRPPNAQNPSVTTASLQSLLAANPNASSGGKP